MLKTLFTKTTIKAMDIDAVTPGMTLAFPIARNGFLIGKGACLTTPLLHQLRAHGIHRICVR